MSEEPALERRAPEAGEEIHLPGPSVLPLVTAVGITLIVIGTTVNWMLSALGVIITVICVSLWVRSTRSDIDDLPEEHRH